MTQVTCRHCAETTSNWVAICQRCKKFNPTKSKRSFAVAGLLGLMVIGAFTPVDETPSTTNDTANLAAAPAVSDAPINGTETICYTSRAIGPVFYNNDYTNSYVGMFRFEDRAITPSNFDRLLPALCNDVSAEELDFWSDINLSFILNKHLGSGMGTGNLKEACGVLDPKSDETPAMQLLQAALPFSNSTLSSIAPLWERGQNIGGGCLTVPLLK